MLARFSHTIDRIEGQIIKWSAPSSLSPLRYLVAVSGGADSMCLADLCLRTLGVERFEVAHCNFHLRGSESDGDQELVAAWASSNGVCFHHVDFDTEEYAVREGVSIEMAARDLRYGWFSELCRTRGLCGVMTAHNANDNAETLILNLLRGTGLHGISGMSEISRMDDLLVLRPLLACTRNQIEGYAFAWKIPYRNDSTNAMSDYKRNRVRNEVFPHFEKINPSFVRTLNREMTYFSEASEILDKWCEERVTKVCSVTEGQAEEVLRISIPALLAEPHWKSLLYHILSPYRFHSAVLASLESLLTSDRTVSGKRFESDGHLLLTERNDLVLVRKINDVSGDIQGGDTGLILPVRTSGRYHFNGRVFTVELLPWTAGMPLRQPPGVLVFDADRLNFPFVCRRWNHGDWLCPLGMKGKKKVSDLFADLKYDSASKESAIMIVDVSSSGNEDGHVAAVMGERMDERYRITDITKNIIRIVYE